MTHAHATENTTGSVAVAARVTDVAGLRFNPGPVGTPVTFSYPFVFASQN